MRSLAPPVPGVAGAIMFLPMMLLELVGVFARCFALMIRLFANMLARRNPAGLLSEDLDGKTGELWGNLPQTYSMVGLINSAMRLSKRWEEAL